jgi:hypothetical protein
LWLPEKPTTKYLYLHFKTFPSLAPLAVLVRVVRADAAPGGGFNIGAGFVTVASLDKGPPSTKQVAAAKVIQAKLLMDSKLGD